MKRTKTKHFDSGARKPGSPSSFQTLKGKLEKEKKEKKKEERKRKRLEKALQKEKEEKEKEKKARKKLEGELGVEREQRQDVVNDAVRARMAFLGLATPF